MAGPHHNRRGESAPENPGGDAGGSHWTDSYTGLGTESSKMTREELEAQYRRLLDENFSLIANNVELENAVEEFTAVNRDSEAQLEALETKVDDLENLARSTHLRSILLDGSLCVRKFTPKAVELLHLRDGEQRSPIGQIGTALQIEPIEIQRWAEEVLAKGKDAVIEKQLPTYDGRWFLIRVTHAAGRKSRYNGVVLTFSDITEVRDADDQRHEIDQRFRLLVEATSSIDWQTNGEGYIDEPIESWEIYTGQIWPAYQGLRWMDMIADDSRDTVSQLWSAPIEQSSPTVRVEFRLWNAVAKSYRQCVLRAVPVAVANDPGLRWFGAIADIEDLNRASDQAQRRNHLLETIISNSDTAVVVTDCDGGLLLANDKAATIFNRRDRAEMIERSIWDIMPAEGARAWREADEEVINKRAQLTYENLSPGVEGEEDIDRVYFTIKFPLIEQKDGPVYGIGTIVTDITEQKKEEYRDLVRAREIEMINKELESKNRDLDEFASMASHDLKQPLRIIENYAGMLVEECGNELRPEIANFVHRMQEASRRACELIEATLNYSRLGRAAVDRKVDADIEKIAETVIADFQNQIETHGIEIDLQPLLSTACDPELVYHILSNLIGNSIKYRGAEHPEIEVSCDGGGSRKVPAYCVRDNGIGFSQNYSERVFEPFHRLHTPEDYPGIGIGLAITRKIVERHGGEIEIESREGEGTAVYFTLNKPNIDTDELFAAR